MSERIFRYPETISVGSHLEPLTDIVSWIQRLRSRTYTSDLLNSVHGMSTPQAVDGATKAIKVHIDSAIALLEQSFASNPQVSYLPTYYAMASLAKIMIISKGYQQHLEQQRRHGASWSGIASNPRNLLGDHITLMKDGVIPLIYKSISGTQLPLDSKNKRKIYLKDVYGHIVDINHEYLELTKQNPPLESITVSLEQDNHKYFVKVLLHPLLNRGALPRSRYKIVQGLHRVGQTRFESVRGTKEDVLSAFPRYLIYDASLPNEPISRALTLTPVSASRLLLPEEIPLYLAFYHLSNVVRYDPERLYKFFDGEEVSLLLALSKHGIYRFLILFWSFMMNKSYQINLV